MGRPAQDITESELSVLRILWDQGPASIRQLADILYPNGEAAQYATIQKLLDRMEAKGYVRRDRTLYVHVFTAVLDRDQLIGRRLRSLAEMLCDGSLTPLLTHLARATDLTEKDRLALRAIMDEIEPDSDSQTVSGVPDAQAKAVGGASRTSRSRSSGGGRGGAPRS
jgi:BlaI family transcriptional regulator, penicillinase repressor